jgi:hypothetical protein
MMNDEKIMNFTYIKAKYKVVRNDGERVTHETQ